MKRCWNWIRESLPYALLACCALLAVVRWTVQDAWHSTAIPFYFGRPVVLAAMLFVAAFISMRNRRKRTAVVTGSVGLVMTVIWAVQSFRFNDVSATGPSHRAVVWNVMSGRFGWEGIFEKLRDIDADVIILVEAFDVSRDRDAVRARILPDLRATIEQDGLMVLSRHEIANSSFDRIGRGSHCLLVKMNVNDAPLNLIAVDVESDPRRFRKYPLEDLATMAARFADQPLIVGGDFNTPPDSVHFAQMRAVLQNAFESVGDGYEPTWPSLAPVIALDQFWVNERIDGRLLESAWTVHSDHRPVILEFGL